VFFDQRTHGAIYHAKPLRKRRRFCTTTGTDTAAGDIVQR
jgi:hypothetical protein